MVALLHIYGDSNIFLLFCVHSITEFELQDIYIISVAWPISQRKQYQSLYETTISILYNMV